MGSLDKLHVGLPDLLRSVDTLRCRDGTEDNNYNFDKEADPDVFQTLGIATPGCEFFCVSSSVDVCGHI